MRVIESGQICSACCNASVDGRHVDFEAAWDGPVLDREGTRVVIDDLIVCERCIRNAVDALDVSPEAAQVLQSAAENATLKADEWKAYAEKLEAQIAGRPEPLKRTGRVKKPA